MIFIHIILYIHDDGKKDDEEYKKLYVCLSRVALYLKSKSNISVYLYDWS